MKQKTRSHQKTNLEFSTFWSGRNKFLVFPSHPVYSNMSGLSQTLSWILGADVEGWSWYRERREFLPGSGDRVCSEQSSSPGADICRATLKQGAILVEHGLGCPHPAQGGGSLCWLHHVLLTGKGKGPGMLVFEPHSSSGLPRENCQWGVPVHKKWSSSWGLDYFTWKNQTSFLPASIVQ